MRVLAEIRDAFLELVNAESSIGQEISASMDISHIEEQLKAKAYEWESSRHLVGFCISVIMRIQHPSRFEEAEREWKVVGKEMLEASEADQPHTFCNALKFILERINKMRIDAANAR